MSTSNVIKMPGVSQLPETKTYREVRSSMDTVLLSKEGIENWKLPPFQRPLRVNQKVLDVAEEIKKNGGIIPGILTVGILNKSEKYLLDGQHRIEAFKISGLPEAIADMRQCHFDSMAEMGDEFVKLNSRLVVMRPDDILRGIEASTPALTTIRQRCPFIGYDNIRRGARAPVLSMSLALRAWMGSAQEVPAGSALSARSHLERLTPDEVNRLIHFFNVVHSAWRNDPEYYRCWSGINLTIAAWLWRRCVIGQSSVKVTAITPQQFEKGMLALTTDKSYLDWLVGRSLSERDRSPCYKRMKEIISTRLQTEIGRKVMLPSPPWATGK